MIISIDAEKPSDEIQHPFMIKKISTNTEEMCSNIKWPYMPSPQLIAYSTVKTSFDIFCNQEQDKDAHTHHFYSV